MASSSTTAGRPTVAVVGSGVAGLTVAYLLQRKFDVTLFEADDRLGGHAHTHDVLTATGIAGLDTGFLVHNARTYPCLLRLFRRTTGRHPEVGDVDERAMRRLRPRIRRRQRDPRRLRPPVVRLVPAVPVDVVAGS